MVRSHRIDRIAGTNPGMPSIDSIRASQIQCCIARLDMGGFQGHEPSMRHFFSTIMSHTWSFKWQVLWL